jgi:hypothetical protein
MRVIPFQDIRCVAYDYQGPSSSAAARLLTDDNEEFFTVGLRLHDQTYVPLFRFSGYKRGNQEQESRAYAERISKIIGVPLSR